MEKFRNTYRIPSARLQSWDYRWAGAYFITICTKHRLHYFGEIKNHSMILSEIGNIADALWRQIPHHVANIELGAFVVMPNHIHGILIIPQNSDDTNPVETLHATSLPQQSSQQQSFKQPQSIPITNPVETLHATSLQQHQPMENRHKFLSRISPKSNSISTIVRSYKSAVSKHTHRLGFDFHWQTRFHDHIIRNEEAFRKISDYIIHNPAHWHEDTFFSP